MAHLFIPELNEVAKERLAARARQHGRNVEAEAQLILEEAVAQTGFEEPTGHMALDDKTMGLGDLAYEHFKERGLTDEEFARFNAGVIEVDSQSDMRIPDFEAEDLEEQPSAI